MSGAFWMSEKSAERRIFNRIVSALESIAESIKTKERIAELESEVRVLRESTSQDVFLSLQAKVNELEGEKARLWEYVNDHVHSFIDSDEIVKLLSYPEWRELFSEDCVNQTPPRYIVSFRDASGWAVIDTKTGDDVKCWMSEADAQDLCDKMNSEHSTARFTEDMEELEDQLRRQLERLVMITSIVANHAQHIRNLIDMHGGLKHD